MNLEERIAYIAKHDDYDPRAFRALKILQQRYDKRYRYCPELDYIVIKGRCEDYQGCNVEMK